MGLISSGILAVPILAGSASFAIAELRGWRSGLDEPFNRARRFYVVFGTAIAIGIALNLLNVSPIRMLYYSAIANGLAAPPLMIIIMLVANNERVMGERTNTRSLNVLGWAATALMATAALAMIAV